MVPELEPLRELVLAVVPNDPDGALPDRGPRLDGVEQITEPDEVGQVALAANLVGVDEVQRFWVVDDPLKRLTDDLARPRVGNERNVRNEIAAEVGHLRPGLLVVRFHERFKEARGERLVEDVGHLEDE